MEIISRSVKDTLTIGRLIAKNLKAGDILCLFGQLGSGKTVLTKGIAEGLGINKSRIISPTFVLLRGHEGGRIPLYHFDLYRLKQPKDILALGYEEYLYDEGVAVVEWADRFKYLAPTGFLKVELFMKKDSIRQLQFCAFGLRHKELLKKIREDIRH